jgi:hypothetical protein
MNTNFSRLALAQLDEILTYIAQRSPQGASAWRPDFVGFLS